MGIDSLAATTQPAANQYRFTSRGELILERF
jgi:hypothetical protein